MKCTLLAWHNPSAMEIARPLTLPFIRKKTNKKPLVNGQKKR
jgi:hypothetical protein